MICPDNKYLFSLISVWTHSVVLNNGSHVNFHCYGMAMKLILPRSQVCAAVKHENY